MPFGSPWGIPGWLVHAYRSGSTHVLTGLHAVSKHTGIPVVVVAALALVISYRLARRSARLMVEVGLVVALLLGATRMGWIHW